MYDIDSCVIDLDSHRPGSGNSVFRVGENRAATVRENALSLYEAYEISDAAKCWYMDRPIQVWKGQRGRDISKEQSWTFAALATACISLGKIE